MARTESTMVALGTALPPFALEDVRSGQTIRSAESLAGKRGLLVMFVCAHCPYVQHVELELGRIGREFAAHDGADSLAIVAIQSNDVATYPQDGPEGMREQAARCGWNFPYLLDRTQAVARAFDAACTPDFYLFDAEGRLAYRGQLDSSRPRRGDSGNDTAVTGSDLRAAIVAVLAGEVPAEPQVASLGCNIKWAAGTEAH